MAWPQVAVPEKPLCPVKSSDLRQALVPKAEPAGDIVASNESKEEFMMPSSKKIPPPPPLPVPDGMYEVPEWQYEMAIMDYRLRADEYKELYKAYSTEQQQDRDMDMRMYNLTLVHCTPEVEAALKGLSV